MQQKRLLSAQKKTKAVLLREKETPYVKNPIDSRQKKQDGDLYNPH